jgi:hypothetical protein
MSHRIEYFHLAIKFPELELKEALPGENIFGDHYICLALGGDSNMTTSHPDTGREVCSRRWAVVAEGGAADCIKEVCRYAGECEVGHMRLTGERYTKPESYIRSWRGAIEKALPYDRVLDAGLAIAAKLSVPSNQREGREYGIKALSAHLLPVEDALGNLSWTLNLLDSGHAASFFMFGHVDRRDPWEKAKADGPRFGRGFAGLTRAVAMHARVAA